jgi:hypothetical protein
MPTYRFIAARAAHTLHVRVGRWFEATASGWGVAIVPFVLLAVTAAALAFFGGSR